MPERRVARCGSGDVVAKDCSIAVHLMRGCFESQATMHGCALQLQFIDYRCGRTMSLHTCMYCRVAFCSADWCSACEVSYSCGAVLVMAEGHVVRSSAE